VDADEVTPTRTEYHSEDGYSGYRADFTFSRRIDRWWLGGFIRYDSLQDSVVTDSPLVTANETLMAGISLVWIIGER
jgi:outer membrane scaffolding protein for murein synthesis (MipA/OmpV family)